MNIFTDYEGTLNAMAEMEGQGWRELTTTESRPESVKGALAFIEEAKKMQGESPTVVVYGNYGFHRYFIKGDGEVLYSRMHGLEEDAEQATRLGFTIN